MADRVEKMAIILQELIDGGISVESLNLTSKLLINHGTLNIYTGSKKTKDGYHLLLSSSY